jgi:hypothetical protein
LTRLETPLRVSVRSPYYVVPVARLEPRDGCATLDDAERHAQATWRSRGPVAVVQVALQVARRWTRKRAGHDGRDGAPVRELAVSRRL